MYDDESHDGGMLTAGGTDNAGNGQKVKPVLFLDIDGVLNVLPIDRGVAPKSEWQDLTRHEVPNRIGTFVLWLSSTMASELLKFDLDVRWLTTWAEDADNVGELVGIPPGLPVAASPPPYGSKPWKLYAVQEFVEENPGHPFVWIDDDAIDQHAMHWLSTCGSKNLAVRTDPFGGITSLDIMAIEYWMNELSPSVVDALPE